MIDFRYHLVSLISVFLALAVGVILGAGPLKEAIGDQLTGQVSQLREEKQSLRDELDRTLHNSAGTDEFLHESAAKLVAGTLAERRVVLIAVGTVDSAATEAVTSVIDEAGGEVVGNVSLLEGWYDTELADARQSYAASLGDYLSANSASGTYDQVLGRSLALAFSSSADELGNEFSAEADLVRGILVSGDLIQVIEEPTKPADAYLIIEPNQEEDVSDSDEQAKLQEQREQNSAVLAQTVDSLARSAEGAAVVGTSDEAGTLISAIRNSDAISATVSTVTGSDTALGQLSSVLALSDQISRRVEHYGPWSSDSTFPQGNQLGAPARQWMTQLGASTAGSADAQTDQTDGESAADQAQQTIWRQSEVVGS